MQRYSSEEHFNRLQETSNFVRRSLQSYEEQSSPPRLLADEPVWKKRIINRRSTFLRSLIVRNVLEMVYPKQYDWHEFENVLSVVELFSISTYQSDRVFDLSPSKEHENSVEDWKRESSYQYITSYVTYTDALDKLLESSLDSDVRSEFIEKMLLAARHVYKGQYIDGFILKKDNSPSPLNLSETDFLDKYIERCKKLDGYQFAMCFYYGLVRKDERKVNTYERIGSLFWEIGIHFGVCIQILNDMEDLLHSEGGNLEDVKQRKVTYPIYLLWNRSEDGKELLQSYWENGGNIEEFYGKIQSIIQSESKVIERLLDLMMSHYNEISSNVDSLVDAGISDVQYLDFIFPHIFLSRIAKRYVRPDQDYNALIESVR